MHTHPAQYILCNYDIAGSIQRWRDEAGIDNSGITARVGSDYWELLDGTKKGQCAEGSLLMEMALRLIGIPAEYQHVLPTETLPVPVYSYSNQDATNPKRNHGEHGLETLYMYFENAGDFTGWNQGEGCCLVNSDLYTAWANGIIGTIQETRTAAHHVLIQLEEGTSGDLQRWKKENGYACDDGDTVPVPPVP